MSQRADVLQHHVVIVGGGFGGLNAAKALGAAWRHSLWRKRSTRRPERQGADGAIGLWRTGDALSSPWLGAYTTDFLFRAKAAGYVVPDAALDKAVNYRMSPSNIGVLTAARADVWALANNHVLDYGRAGLLETLDILAAAGLLDGRRATHLQRLHRQIGVARGRGLKSLESGL